MPKPASPMRFPGSIAEVEASPAGPGVGAFFDLDGTLIAGYSGIASDAGAHAAPRPRRGRTRCAHRCLGGINLHWASPSFEELIGAAAIGLRGRPTTDIEEMGERLFAQKIERAIYPEMREIWCGRTSAAGTPSCCRRRPRAIQVEPVARYLGIDHVLCNRFETEDGILTGEVEQARPVGPGKADAVQQFAADHGVDLARATSTPTATRTSR